MAYSHDKVKPYEAARKGKKEQVSNMFDNIAPYYDFLNHFLSLGIDRSWRKKAIRLLGESKPGKVLDVATGTGDMAIEIARQTDATEIIGIDISKEMLAVGQKKLAKKSLESRISLFEGDSENMTFPNNTFDAVSVAFGVRNFEDLDKGLREIRRVLGEGGKLVVLEFSKPTVFPFKQIFNFYFKYMLPLIGRITSKDPKAYQYLYESVQAFPDKEMFLKVLESAGYRSVKYIPLSLGICSIYTGEK